MKGSFHIMTATTQHTICSKMLITEQNRAEHYVTQSTTGTELRKCKGIQSVTAHSLRTCIKHFPKNPHCTFLHPAVGTMYVQYRPNFGHFLSSTYSKFPALHISNGKTAMGQCFYLTQPEISQHATDISGDLFCSPLEPRISEQTHPRT